MTTFYCWDAAGLYVGTKEADEDGQLPERSTPTKPMKLTGSQVALDGERLGEAGGSTGA